MRPGPSEEPATLLPKRGLSKINVLAPDLCGGGMTRAYMLAQVVRHLGLQVNVVGALERGQQVYPVPPLDLPVRAVQASHMWSVVQRLLDALDGDLVYAVKPRVMSYGVALLNRAITGAPVLLDIDDWELGFSLPQATSTLGRRSQLKRLHRLFTSPVRLLHPNHAWYLQAMERLVPQADAITVNNRRLQACYGGSLLPSGKDTALFDPARFDPDQARRRYGLHPYRVLMFPGTPRPHKGLEDVLLALDRLGLADLRLVLVGGRMLNYGDELRQRWPRWVVQLPRYPLADMPSVIAAAHLVVVAQRNTPIAQAQLPMKLTDAMAMAKPIIATCVGDVPEVLGDTGHIVLPERPDQLAERIDWILRNPAAAQAQAQRARQRCIEHYSLEALGRILAGVLQAHCAGRSGAEPAVVQ